MNEEGNSPPLNLSFSLGQTDIMGQLYEKLIPRDLITKRKLSNYNVKVIDIRTDEEVDIDSITWEEVHKNTKYYRMLSKDEIHSDKIQYIGTEIEMRLNPHIWELRKSKFIIDNIIRYGMDKEHGFKLPSFTGLHNQLSEVVKQSLNLTIESRNYLIYYLNTASIIIFNNTCTGFSRPCHQDGLNIEVSLLPMSEKAYGEMYDEIEYILELYSILGYKGKQDGCGIHTHYSLASLGKNKKEISKSIIKFLWFLYNNPYLMCLISNRKFEDSIRADMFYLINEDAPLMTPTHQIRDKFIALKDEMIENWMENRVSFTPTFNIMINKKPKETPFAFLDKSNDTVEFRWWASTNKINRFMFNIDFSFRILEFIMESSSLEDLKFKNFYQYLIEIGEHDLLNMMAKKFSKKLAYEQQNRFVQ